MPSLSMPRQPSPVEAPSVVPVAAPGAVSHEPVTVSNPSHEPEPLWAKNCVTTSSTYRAATRA